MSPEPLSEINSFKGRMSQYFYNFIYQSNAVDVSIELSCCQYLPRSIVDDCTELYSILIEPVYVLTLFSFIPYVRLSSPLLSGFFLLPDLLPTEICAIVRDMQAINLLYDLFQSSRSELVLCFSFPLLFPSPLRLVLSFLPLFLIGKVFFMRKP